MTGINFMLKPTDDRLLLNDAVQRGFDPGVCARIKEAHGKTLLIKRSPHDNYPGLWELPGGSVNLDESPRQAIKREVVEEVGLKITKLKYVGYFDFKNVENNKTKRKFCFEARVRGRIKLDKDHSTFKWFSLEAVRKLKVEGRDDNYEIWNDHYQLILL